MDGGPAPADEAPTPCALCERALNLIAPDAHTTCRHCRAVFCARCAAKCTADSVCAAGCGVPAPAEPAREPLVRDTPYHAREPAFGFYAVDDDGARIAYRVPVSALGAYDLAQLVALAERTDDTTENSFTDKSDALLYHTAYRLGIIANIPRFARVVVDLARYQLVDTDNMPGPLVGVIYGRIEWLAPRAK